jgi:hypothetical protein
VLQVFDGGVMGFIILLIALYEAWKINKKPEIEIQGPFATPAAVPFAAPALQPELAPASPFSTP